MNILHFMTTQLLPNIPDHSIIILDNVSYHNGVVEKIPTKSLRKFEMQEWLDKHGIEYDSSDLRADKIVATQPCI